MLLNPDTAFLLTGYPLARLRGWLYRGRVQGGRVRSGVWQFEIHSLHAYLTEIQRLESAPDFRRAIAQKGGLVRARAFTRAYQQWARAHVRRESNVANGRLGGIAYVRKYGKRSLVERARQYRLTHPSNLVFYAEPGVSLTSHGEPVTVLTMLTTASGAPTQLTLGTLDWQVLQYGDRFAVRVWDRNNSARREFAGRRWFPIDAAYRVSAHFVRYAEPRRVDLATIVDGISESSSSPGYVTFRLRGQAVQTGSRDARCRRFALHLPRPNQRRDHASPWPLP